MAENKNALVNETANENGNAALTERLDNVAERMAEAEKATAAVAEEQKQRLAEQEQSTEQLQKAEEERRAQAAEAAKSEADRRAAALDYTENYRENQKMEKAARATVSKAKMERLAAEAEAKAKAEQEAEEALRREREELMARRQRSSELLKKVENNESEAQAPEAQTPVAAPAEPAMPAPEAEPVEKPEAEAPEAEAPAEQEPMQDETPDILDTNPQNEASEQAPVADDAASAEESAPEAAEDSINNNETPEQMADDIRRAKEEAEAQEHAAEVSRAVDEDLMKMRIAQMVPARMIPESLRLYKTTDKAEYDRKVDLRSPEKVNPSEIDEALKKLEDAVAASEKSNEARLAAALEKMDNMTRRSQEDAEEPAGESTAAPKVVRAVNLGTSAIKPSREAVAAAALNSGKTGEAVLPEAFGSEEFSQAELRRYLKQTKKEIKQKKKELANLKKERGETKEDFERRRMERHAAVLGAQLGAVALLSHKRYFEEAEPFMFEAEEELYRYNSGVEKYNRKAAEHIEPLPENLVRQVAKEGRVPKLPFGSAATGLDAALTGGVSEGPVDRKEQKKLRKEMQREMLLHAMEWNPAAASMIKEEVDKNSAKENKQKQKADKQELRDAYIGDAKVDKKERKDRKASRKARASEALQNAHHIAMEAERSGRPADEKGRNSKEIYEAYLAAANEEKKNRKSKDKARESDALYATYLATVAEEESKRTSDKKEDRKKHRVSGALHAAYLAALKDAKKERRDDKKEAESENHRISDAIGAAYRDALADERMAEASGRKSDDAAEALEAAYLAAKEEEQKRAADGKKANTAETLLAAKLAAEKAEKKNKTSKQGSTSEALEAAYVAAKKEEQKSDSESTDALEAAYLAARAEEKKGDSEEESNASDMLYAAYMMAKDEEKKERSKKQKSDEKKSDSAEEEASKKEKEEKEERTDALYAAYLAALAEEKQAEDEEDSAEDSEEDDDQVLEEDYGDDYEDDEGALALWENEDLGISDEEKAKLEQLQRRFLYEQAHASYVDEEFSPEDIYNAKDAMAQQEAVAAAAEKHFTSKHTIDEIRREGEDYANATKWAEWTPDPKETEKSIREAAAKAKQEANFALDRIARDYEAQIRACAEAEREARLLAALQPTEKELAAAERKAEKLAREADRKAERLEKLRLVKEATDEKAAISIARKAEMLALAVAAAEEEADAEKEERLKKRAAYIAKKEAKAAKRAEKKDRKRRAILEKRCAISEANARASEEAAALAEDKIAVLRAENAEKEVLHEAYDAALRENSKASEARRAANYAKAKRDEEKAIADQKKEAIEAMLAFAASMGAEKVGRKKLNSARKKSRYLEVAIENAELAYSRAMLAVANADDRLLRLEENNAPLTMREAQGRDTVILRAKADVAKEKLLALRATKDALETTTVMRKAEKEELLSLAIEVSENENAKSIDRLKKQIAHIIKKEEAAARKSERELARNLDRWDKHVADTEAKARVFEKSAQQAKAKAEQISKRKAAKLELYEAYEEALLEEAKATLARKSAAEAKAKLDAEKELSRQHKDAKAALLAFAGIVTAAEEAEKKESKKKKAVSATEKQKLDFAIEKAEHLYENAVVAQEAAIARTAEGSADRKALKLEKRKSKVSVARAEDQLDALRAAKIAIEKSHVLSREEKAEMISLVIAAMAEEKSAKASKKLKNKIALAVKKESVAAKAMAREEKDYTANRDKTTVEAETAALLSENAAIIARAKAESLFAKKSNVKALHKAYQHALAEEAKAKRARSASESVKEKCASECERVAEYAEAKAAMLAFAAAFAREEQNKKITIVKKRSSSTKELRKLEAAIAKAVARENRAEEGFIQARAELLRIAGSKASDAERRSAYEAFARFEIERARARAERETLESARYALQKSKKLSKEEKAAILALLLLPEEKKQASAAALQEKIAAAAKIEEKAERKAAKKADRKAKRLENAYLDKSAQELASEETASDAKQKAIRLTRQKANKKELYKAYREALLEQSKAENAKLAADQARAKQDAAAECAESHKEARLALLAFSSALTAEEQAKKNDTRHTAVDSVSVDSALMEAESLYAQALEQSAIAKQKARALNEKKAPAKKLAAAYENALRAEDEAKLAAERVQTLKEAKAAAEGSTALSAEERAGMLALLMEGNAPKKAEKKLQKREDSKRRKNKTAEESIAAATAEVLVSEESAQRAAEKVAGKRIKKSSKKSLQKAYKEALSEQSRAEKARLLAEAESLSGYDSANSADSAENRSAAMAEMYARTCEAKAELSEKKALILASKRGRKNEKLKAYEAALLDRVTAVQARAEADMMGAENASEASDEEKKLLETAERNTATYAKALAKLDKKQKKHSAKKRRGASKSSDLALADESASPKKLEKAELAREKARIKIEMKVRKADAKAQGRAAAKDNPRLAAKLRYQALKAERQRIADAKAWELMVQRDDALDRHRSFMTALNLEKKDLARIAAQKEAAADAKKASEAQDVAPAAKPAVPVVLSRREKVRRFKAFRKLDMEVLASRYDYEIAEAQRALELSLSDLTCTEAMSRRLQDETDRRIANLKAKKRKAMKIEKADNKRYMSCLRARTLRPKRRGEQMKLIEMRNRLFELLAQRNEENERLRSLCCEDAYRDAKTVDTPWHKAFLKEKKYWQKKCDKEIRKIRELALGRTEKQKLLAELDRVANAHADIAEAKVRAKKTKLRGVAKQQYKWEMKEMKREVRRANRRMKRRMRAAIARSVKRQTMKLSLLYLAITLILVADIAILWWIFGENVVRLLNEHFPGVMSLLK